MGVAPRRRRWGHGRWRWRWRRRCLLLRWQLARDDPAPSVTAHACDSRSHGGAAVEHRNDVLAGCAIVPKHDTWSTVHQHISTQQRRVAQIGKQPAGTVGGAWPIGARPFCSPGSCSDGRLAGIADFMRICASAD